MSNEYRKDPIRASRESPDRITIKVKLETKLTTGTFETQRGGKFV